MDGPQLYTFVDVLSHDTWTDGLVVGVTDTALRVQTQSTVLCTSQVRPFRTQTHPASPISSLPLYAVDLELMLCDWLETRKYWFSDQQFVQFFGGIVPYLYSPEAVRREEMTNYRAARALQDYYKLALERPFQPTESPGNVTWTRLIPVLCVLLRDDELLVTRRSEVFSSYVTTMSALALPTQWLECSGEVLHCLRKSFQLGEGNMTLSINLAQTCIRHFIRISKNDEGLKLVIIMMKSQGFTGKKINKRLEILIQNTLDVLKIASNLTILNELRRKIVIYSLQR